MNKYQISLLLILATTSMIGCSTTSTPPVPVTNTPATVNETIDKTLNTVSVNIQNFNFIPQTLTVNTGGSVTWTNNDSAPHIINSPSFNSSSLSKGESFTQTFSEPGTFDYTCSLHPSMKGQIIVK